MARNYYSTPLDIEGTARLTALYEMCPRRGVEELLGELVDAVLGELEASFPYVKGSRVVVTDEWGDPLYENIDPTPRFLLFSRKYLHELVAQQDTSGH